MVPASSDRPLRADARRNVELLLATARTVFAEQGVEAPLDEIARRSGVGNATLYRRFPTRRALLEALHRQEIETLCERATQLREQPPDEALRTWLRELLRHGSTSRGLTAALTASLHGEDSGHKSECREMVVAAVTALLDRAQRHKAVRDDVDAGQLLKLVNAIAYATEREPDAQRQAGKLLDLVMDGLRYRTTATVA